MPRSSQHPRKQRHSRPRFWFTSVASGNKSMLGWAMRSFPPASRTCLRRLLLPIFIPPIGRTHGISVKTTPKSTCYTAFESARKTYLPTPTTARRHVRVGSGRGKGGSERSWRDATRLIGKAQTTQAPAFSIELTMADNDNCRGALSPEEAAKIETRRQQHVFEVAIPQR